MDQVREVLRITGVFIALSKMIVNEFFFIFIMLTVKRCAVEKIEQLKDHCCL